MQPLPSDGGSDDASLPSQRPIDRRQFLQLSALGAAGFVGATRLHTTHQKPRVPAKAERGGWFRYNNEDDSGAISYINPKYFETPDALD